MLYHRRHPDPGKRASSLWKQEEEKKWQKKKQGKQGEKRVVYGSKKPASPMVPFAGKSPRTPPPRYAVSEMHFNALLCEQYKNPGRVFLLPMMTE
jgi:hypothetical protein